MNLFNQTWQRTPGPFEPIEVRRIAERAILGRLGDAYAAEYGLIGCLRHVHNVGDQTAAVHLNSGGNAAAVAEAFMHEGYAVWRGTRPDCGVVLIVSRSARIIDTNDQVRRYAVDLATRTGRPLGDILDAWRGFKRYWDEPLTSSNWDNYRPAMSTCPDHHTGSASEWFISFHQRWLPAGLSVALATHGLTAGQAFSVHAEVMETPGFAHARRALETGSNPSAAVLRLVSSWRWHVARAAQGLTSVDRLNLQAIDDDWVTNLSGPSNGWTPCQAVTDEIRAAWAMLAALKPADGKETGRASTTDTRPSDASPAAVSERQHHR
ncbi:hypothetical protein [Nocardioides bigeumensis]|uniref:Uncharacterized protein n=1 Tax=Nocardioides bigeumensis TaxID=433657 RepID=A0ABP5KKE7_9ACTN